MDPILTQATKYLARQLAKPPEASAVVEALLAAERQAKRDRQRCTYEDLLGTWKLGFVTGTQKSRQRVGAVLGRGRFLPAWVQITITYGTTEDSTFGTAKNQVKLGALTLTLTGPTRLWLQTNLLAFDFTEMIVKLGQLQLYRGELRGGAEQVRRFCQQQVKDQAFFNYFLVESEAIAARGRGGGLALWARQSSDF